MSLPSQAMTNPFVGPRTFTEKERGLFFGRDREARDLTARIVSERLLLFYAQSGAGKSSLINARVIPKLRDEERFQVLPVGRVSGDLPAGIAQVDNIYVFNLMASLDQSDAHPERLVGITLSDFLARLARETVVAAGDDRAWRWVYRPELDIARPAEDAAQPAAGPRFVLVIDQFEEIITAHPGRWQEREVFFSQLNQALLDDPSLWVVLTLREDYVASLDPYAELTFNRLRARFYMERMSAEAAQEAVGEPARLGGRPFAPGVAKRLVDDLRQVRVAGRQDTVRGQYVEPVQLQVVCFQLWERVGGAGELALSEGSDQPDLSNPSDKSPPEITLADLAAAGDVNQALAQFYQETLAAVLADPAGASVGERRLRLWFDQELITPAGRRGLVHQDEAETGGLPNAVVKALQARFLVRSEARSGDTWIELVHDRFVEPIRSANRTWLEQNQNPLARAAQEWQQAGRPNDTLLKGDRLAEARGLVQAHPDDFSDLEKAFLAASDEAARLAASRRQRLIGTGAAVLAIVFAFLAIFAIANAMRANKQSGEAQAQRDAAVVAQQNAEVARTDAVSAQQQAESAQQDAVAQAYLTSAQSAVASGTLPERSALLSVGSVQYARERGILQPAAAVDQLSRTLASLGGLPLHGHEGAVNAVAFGPGCDALGATSNKPCTPWLASGGADGAVRLWNARNPLADPVILDGHAAAVGHLNFSPDGRWLASSAGDHTVRLWDLAADPPAAAQMLSVDAGVNRLSFSPRGRWLAAATTDGKVVLWDMSRAPQLDAPRVLPQTYAGAISAEFSDDEQWLMTASQDGNFYGEVQLWRSDDGFSQPTKTFPYEYIAGAAMSPDGAWLAVSTPTYTELRSLAEDTDVVQSYPRFGYVYTMAFGPDSRSFAGNGHVWRLNDEGRWEEPVRLVGQPQSGVYFPTFGPGCASLFGETPAGCGRWLAAVSSDYTLFRWDLNDLTRLPYIYRGHEGAIVAVALSPDASQIATAGTDGVVRLWNAHSPTAGPTILHQEDGQPQVRLWDVSAADPARASRLVGPRDDAYHLVAISPDGRWAALASEAGYGGVTVWDLASPAAEPRQLDYYGVVDVMKFSPGCDEPAQPAGQTCPLWLAVGDWNGLLRLWDISAPTTDGFAFVDLPNQGAGVRDLAFSADNRLLVAGDNWGQAKVWRLDPPDPTQQPIVLSGHNAIVRAVAISPSGRWVLTGTWEPDVSARLWDLESSITQPATTLPFQGRLFAAAFSPDERWAAAGSWDATAKLVRLDDPELKPITLDQHRGRILSMAMSRDSHWLATSGEDRRIILWDLTAADPSVAYAVLRSPTGSGPGTQVAFSADGRWLSAYGAAAFSSQAPRLVTADDDVHLYNLPEDEVMDRICLAVGRSPTEEGWQRYAPGMPYRAICPEPAANPLAGRLHAQSLATGGN